MSSFFCYYTIMTPDYIRLATVHDCAAVYSLICEMEEKELPFSDFESIYQSQCAVSIR